MTTIAPNGRLYRLLPALYEIADDERQGQLKALLDLVNRKADALRDDVYQLWDDYFIETCQRWVIPYIGDLVGNGPLHDLDLSDAVSTAESLFTDLRGPNLRPPFAVRTRADVAKTISYRRRKGTPVMLEELARDVTGWDAHIVEFFTLLDWNQHLEHLRPEAHGCPDLRRVDVGDRVGGTWDGTTHTVDVRRINTWNGWYNLPNVGFFLWRLGAYRLRRITPRPVGAAPWRLTFSPLGNDIPLFCAGAREPSKVRLATELSVEGPMRPAAFFEDLRSLPPAPPPTKTSEFYGDPENPTTDASLVVFSNGVPVNASEVECANLGGWTSFAQPAGTKILIDVGRGRLVPQSGRPAETLTLSYYYGFSAPMGGGEYDRRKWLVPGPTPPAPVIGGAAALDAKLATRGAQRVIEIGDDATYRVDADITLNTGESLVIQATDEHRPHLRLKDGSIAVRANGPGASLTLSGLLIEGGLRIEGDLRTLRLLHTTLVPGRSVEQGLAAAVTPVGPSLTVSATAGAQIINTGLEVQIAFGIVGALRIPSQVTRLWLLDSIVDGIEKDGDRPASAITDAAGTSGPPAHIERSTILGSSRFLKLDLASESIFTGLVTVDHGQDGCVRFSYVPPGSDTPQKYRCQPALEIAAEQERGGDPTAIEAAVGRWLVPSFESEQYGRPEFAQLRRTCPEQIRAGAEDGSEMGAFCVLKQSQREANLRMRLDEYLPVGLEAGIVYVT